MLSKWVTWWKNVPKDCSTFQSGYPTYPTVTWWCRIKYPTWARIGN